MTARDEFERYYAAKLWSLIPEVHRTSVRDPHAPEVMRRWVEVVGAQLAELRRQTDLIWDSQSIERCADALVPAFADRVGTRLVEALDPAAQRIDVANTLHYRRRRGTVGLLRAIMRDIFDLDAILVEGFRTLERRRHLLDRPSDFLPLTGEAPPLSRTPPGGLADLRRPLPAAWAHTPFDEMSHLVDVRTDRRYGIERARFDLFPLRARIVDGAQPVLLEDAGVPVYTFDPSGRDIPLFSVGRSRSRARRPSARLDPSGASLDAEQATKAWEVAGPIPCRLLGQAEYQLRLAGLRTLLDLPTPPSPAGETALRAILGVRFSTGAALAARLAELGVLSPGTPAEPGWYRVLLRLARVEDCAKSTLLGTGTPSIAVDSPLFDPDGVDSANLADRIRLPTPKDGALTGLIDPERGRFARRRPSAAFPEPPRVRYGYGTAFDLGAGTYSREGLIDDPAPLLGGGPIGPIGDGLVTLGDNSTFEGTFAPAPRTTSTLQAADGARPYFRLGRDGGATNVTLIPTTESPSLRLDGIWLGWQTSASGALELAQSAPPSNPDWSDVSLRHMTLDPGGRRADSQVIAPVTLRISGHVDRLLLERCVVGRIEVAPGGFLRRLRARDTLFLGAPEPSTPLPRALELPRTDVDLARCTVIGGLACERLHATDSICAGEVIATQTQSGCFRFSAAPSSSRLPPRFRSWPEPGGEASEDLLLSYFRSLRFGHPSFGRLGRHTPEGIRRGAENGSEMGVYARTIEPLRIDGARTKVEEYAPVTIIPSFFSVT